MVNGQTPVVSVIVPARNEEACLALCLESLVSQAGIDFEIIVVDDASTDRTAEIARSFATAHVGAGALTRPTPDEGVRGYVGFATSFCVVSAPPLPENWTGKNNAMYAGAKIAKGKWLLFTDADTVHKPGSLTRATTEAEKHGSALLSYSPEQEVRTFWEKAVMPVIFAELATTYPPKKVNDPALPIAAANGQYLLISREAYDAVGGHTKIASDLLEDVAMARLVKSSGRKIFFRYGGDAVRTRMYRSWEQMKEGWTKNLALLFPHSIRMIARCSFEAIQLLLLVTAAIDILLFGPPAIRSQSVLLPHYSILGRDVLLVKWWLPVCVVLLLGRLALFSLHRVRKASFPLRLTVVSMLGPGIFAYLLTRSIIACRNHAVEWKGRTYGNTPVQSTPVAAQE